MTGEGVFEVRVQLDGSDRDIYQLLHALQDHVIPRELGPAHLEVGAHHYTIDPGPDPGGLN